MPNMLRSTIRTCRRQHKNPCFACGLPILPGDEYEEAAFACDGRVYTTTEHRWCSQEIAALLRTDGYDYEYESNVLQELTYDASAPWREWYFGRKAWTAETARSTT